MIIITTNPAMKGNGCHMLPASSVHGARMMAAIPPTMVGVKRMMRPVTAVPLPMMSRMMKSIGRRMGVKSVSRLTKRAVDPMTNQTFPITRSTNVRTSPSVGFLRVSHINSHPSTGSSSHR